MMGFPVPPSIMRAQRSLVCPATPYGIETTTSNDRSNASDLPTSVGSRDNTDRKTAGRCSGDHVHSRVDIRVRLSWIAFYPPKLDDQIWISRCWLLICPAAICADEQKERNQQSRPAGRRRLAHYRDAPEVKTVRPRPARSSEERTSKTAPMHTTNNASIRNSLGNASAVRAPRPSNGNVCP